MRVQRSLEPGRAITLCCTAKSAEQRARRSRARWPSGTVRRAVERRRHDEAADEADGVEERRQEDDVAKDAVTKNAIRLIISFSLSNCSAVSIRRRHGRREPRARGGEPPAGAAMASNVVSMSSSIVRCEQIDMRSAMRPRIRVVMSSASPLRWISSAMSGSVGRSSRRCLGSPPAGERRGTNRKQ